MLPSVTRTGTGTGTGTECNAKIKCSESNATVNMENGSGQETCENTKYVPAYWAGYESQFENSCKWNDSKRCVSKTCDSSNLPKYALTGDYAGQYNEKGNILKC